MSLYRNLDPVKTIETLETLNRRIEERFPSSGLAGVCRELCSIANSSKAKAEWIATPNYFIRFLVAVIVVAFMVMLVYSISAMEISLGKFDLGELVQITEAALNEIVLVGAAVFFLVTIEVRIKRARALEALHELRTIAHVIDMHQLTKDPGRLGKNMVPTGSSPREEMTSYNLMRYLDYCSEMLSLTGKIAALYAQDFRDAVVLAAINEIETLTTGLSRKIWQKIMILHRMDSD